MEYTQGTKTMLELLGFAQCDYHKDVEIEYDVLSKLDIEATINHTHKQVTFDFKGIPLHGIKNENQLLDFEERVYGKITK